MAILNDEAASAGAAVQSMMHAAPLFPGSDTDALSYFEGRNRSCSGPKIRRLLAAPKAHFFITFLFVTKDVWETIFAPAARNILYTRKKKKQSPGDLGRRTAAERVRREQWVYLFRAACRPPRWSSLYTLLNDVKC